MGYVVVKVLELGFPCDFLGGCFHGVGVGNGRVGAFVVSLFGLVIAKWIDDFNVLFDVVRVGDSAGRLHAGVDVGE